MLSVVGLALTLGLLGWSAVRALRRRAGRPGSARLNGSPSTR
jgi:hypothetical protein